MTSASDIKRLKIRTTFYNSPQKIQKLKSINLLTAVQKLVSFISSLIYKITTLIVTNLNTIIVPC